MNTLEGRFLMLKYSHITAAILSLGVLSTTVAAGENPKVIDLHCHIAGIGAGNSGCFVSERIRKSWKYGVFLKAFGVSEKDLLQKGDRLIVQRLSETLSQSQTVKYAVVLAMDGVVNELGELDRNNTEIYIPNEFVAAEVRKYDNLLFGASINPYRHDALARLEKAAQQGAVLIKWLPPVQNIDPADERLIPFYVKLRELGLPLLTHTGEERTFTRSVDSLGDPERLRLPLSLGVTVIAAHSAASGRSHGEPNFDRLVRLAGQYPNLYADISSLTQINRLGKLQKALKHQELVGRLLYGTDMPLINTALVTPFAFPFQMPISRMIAISRIRNPWDRDVALKKTLGVGDDVLQRASMSLHLQKMCRSPFDRKNNHHTQEVCS